MLSVKRKIPETSNRQEAAPTVAAQQVWECDPNGIVCEVSVVQLRKYTIFRCFIYYFYFFFCKSNQLYINEYAPRT